MNTVKQVGNLPSGEIQFYTGKAPVIAVAADKRVSYLRFKLDKKEQTKRESMAVISARLAADSFTSKSQVEFLQVLIDEAQDVAIKACADSEIAWEVTQDMDKLIADFNDSSRASNGRKVTKDSISAWFMDNMAELVIARVKTKNAQMQDEALKRVVTGYCEMFQKFTGYNLENAFTEPQIKLLRSLVDAVLVTEEDEMFEWLNTRLTKIEKAKVNQNELLELI